MRAGIRKARPLLVTADPELLDDLLRLVSAVGGEADVAHDLAGSRRLYLAAPIVLLGADAVESGLRTHLPRRMNVAIVCQDAADSRPWDWAAEIGAQHVALLPTAEQWIREKLEQSLRDDEGSGAVLAVIGGRGGAGASVLAAGLAVTATRSGLRTLLVDADPLSGGADLLLGLEHRRGLRWSHLSQASGRIEPDTLLGALPGSGNGDLVVLSQAREEEGDEPVSVLPAPAMTAALDAGKRGRDLVVVDLPRWLDDAATIALQAADLSILVTTADIRGAAASARLASVVQAHGGKVSLVVRGRPFGGMNAREVAEVVGLPLTAALRAEPRLTLALEKGTPPAISGRGPLADVCRTLLELVLP